MPPVADDIYEGELITEEEPTLFFMTQRDDKVGILTDSGYSDIVYDSYRSGQYKMHVPINPELLQEGTQGG